MITKLHLKNFKSIVDEELDLSYLTLLTGVNSSGKSSVIQALRIIQKAALSDFHLNESEDVVTLRGGLPELSGHGNYIDLQSKEGSAEGQNDISFRLEDDNLNHLDFSIFGDLFICEETNLSISNFTNLVYIGADRLGPQVFIPTVKQENNPLGERGEHCYQYIAYNADRKINPPVVKEKQQSLRLAIDSWMSEIAPGSELKATFHDAFDISSLEVDGYRPTNVGFGVSYCLPIITALLAFANSNPEKKINNILCIENPEAHLHPKAQTKMGELIARCAASGTQVIVETHSDHLLDGIRIAVKNKLLSSQKTAIHFFDKINKCTVVESPQLDETGNIKQWPKGFFDQFMVNGRELLK
ncbi:MAG: DUF3696 domain-containing protein [Spirochaetota bacterium]|nr:DUF3696 domain-containing protein [Spirochaetota bacterium]